MCVLSRLSGENLVVSHKLGIKGEDFQLAPAPAIVLYPLNCPLKDLGLVTLSFAVIELQKHYEQDSPWLYILVSATMAVKTFYILGRWTAE